MKEYEYKILKRKDTNTNRAIQKYSKLGFRLMSINKIGDYCGDLDRDGNEGVDYTLFQLVFEREKTK